jgi:ribonuclease P protein component
MTPPQASLTGTPAEGALPEAVFSRVQTLTKRSDFLRASRAARVAAPGFILQMRKRHPGEATGIRVGFTCSKKVGNAVLRNRAKRRLREVARLKLPAIGMDGMDYVLIGRAETTISLPFDQLLSDFEGAVATLHRRHQ